MSSTVRSFPAAAKAETKFVPVKSLTYQNNSIDARVLIPFTYSNGVLDVATIPGFLPSDGEGNGDGFSWRMVKPMGGLGLVTSLGNSFKTWFENYEGGVDSGSIEIYTRPTMTKVQMTVPDGASILNSQYAYRGGLTEAPSSDEFVTGSPSTSWDTVWVFKTPLVLKYKDSGNVRYASLYTQFTNPT